jgi:hypothetical protein
VTLVEVIVAGVVLLLTMIPMGILLANATSAAAQSRQREAAVQLADSWVEILSNSQPQTTPDGGVLTGTVTPAAPAGSQAPSSTLAGTTYDVSAFYEPVSINNIPGTDLCSSGEPPSPSHPDVFEITVTVAWGDGDKFKVSDSTDINYPKPGLQTDGFLAISVSNEGETDVNGNTASERLQVVPVTITGPVTISDLTADQYGCIFVQVPPGLYTVSEGQPSTSSGIDWSGSPAFVTPTGATSYVTPSAQQVNVTAEQTVQLQAFDEGIVGNIAYGGSAAVDSGVECPGSSTITCVTTGSGTSGGSAAWGGSSTAWSTTTLSAGVHVNQVDCTLSSACVGVGYGPTSGVILRAGSDLGTTTPDTVPAGVTDLSQVTCPSATGCYALGVTATGPALLAGKVGPGTDVWSNVTPGTVMLSTLNSLACPTSTTCEISYTTTTGTPGILRLDGDPGTLGSNSAWTPVVTEDALSSAVTSVGTIVCPSATDCEATAIGDAASPFDATVVEAPIVAGGASTWSNESTFPTGASTVTGLSCTATTCLAIGTASGAAAVWTGDLTQTVHNWVQANTIPNSVAAVTSVACGQPSSGDTADCVLGAVSSGQTAVGELLDGGLTNGSWAWNTISPPSGTTVQFFDDVACEAPPSSAAASCAAVGATLTGPLVLSSSTGPGGTWTNVTPTALPGAMVSGIPIETAPSGTSSWTTQVTAGHANVSVLPDVLYPEGYSVVAGDCAGEGNNAPAGTLSGPPGDTTSSATVPLGLVSLQLVNAVGTPVPGITITLTSTTCGDAYADAYNLPATDGYGMTSVSVPYGSYSYTDTIGGTAKAHTTINLTVGPNTVTEAVSGASTTSYLPTPVQVPA